MQNVFMFVSEISRYLPLGCWESQHARAALLNVQIHYHVIKEQNINRNITFYHRTLRTLPFITGQYLTWVT